MSEDFNTAAMSGPFQKNITGARYIAYGLEQALITHFSPAPPATYGVTLGVHFK